jgi:hypothetical protein
MKKTILFASALFAMLLTTAVSGQGTTRPGGGAGAGSTTGAGAGSSSVGGGAGTTTPGGSGKPQDKMITYPKVYVVTPAAKGGQPSRRLLAGNLFKGKDQGIDLTYDVLDPKGNVVPNSVSKNDAGEMIIDQSKLKNKTGNRLRVKGAGTAVEFYPF